ncbi:PREDICTED: uncharacterized protein LOC104752401 [Camelina sativa]|uniref:Uncharacterized protein LOC104752401 n=1 Tax=Camelina sativa TaxID=90675 RepID=A0ABM0WLK8_CAMSA|nr:PREDICTED: uncharacterized protein LOC104752401 [Camelina sativa]
MDDIDMFLQNIRKNRGRLENTPNMIGGASAEKAWNGIKLRLKKTASTSQDNNGGAVGAVDAEEISPLRSKFVLDNDFYDFDKDRVEGSFKENEVWAAYGGVDGMPRLYALVHSVVSQEPFNLSISWLDITNDEEPATMKWVDSGFSKTSGRFSIGERMINTKALKLFSHRLKCTKDAEGFIHIYPTKGDVWALYTNWSPSWGDEDDWDDDEEEWNEFEVVEVVEDFDTEVGVMVLPLVKVPGFKAVFRRDSDQLAFSVKDLLKFSHQVVYHRLTGQEGENVPEDCLELDPAALSRELCGDLSEDELLTEDEMSE